MSSHFKINKPPIVLDAHGKAEWTRITTELNKRGLCDTMDQQIVMLYCLSYQDFLKYNDLCANGDDVITTEKGYQVKAPAATLKREAGESMLKFAKELGVGLANRKKLGLMDDIEEDEFTAFLNKSKKKA
jgi:P27 family predicted phage terminase small subunit